MRIRSANPSDFWYESDDISNHSVILIRRESITCCGFLGGDSIAIIPSINQFINYIQEFRPILPWNRQQSDSGDPRTPTQILREIISELELRSQTTNELPESLYETLSPIMYRFNEEIWLASSSEPFRFSLDIWKDINSFLIQSGYAERLLATFRWWYHNEASETEQLEVPRSLLSGTFTFPEDSVHLIRAVNLYNHGTYELT